MSAVPLTDPVDGVPATICDAQGLARSVAALGGGAGPVAVDAERASGYRYGQRAYLIQLRRRGAGTHLVDPTHFADLTELANAIGDAEWVLHSATQDLPCLAEVGLAPSRIFDTEIAARILGKPRIGLAALVESELGLSMDKEHSAADWSTRPLPEPWLRYAALDVEVLVDLRDTLASQLDESGRRGWAEQEFDFAMGFHPFERADPWRRTSGIHKVRSPRQLAVVRALWVERDGIAQDLDRAPRRVLGDAAIVAAARAMPTTRPVLAALPEFAGRGTRRRLHAWWAAVERAQSLPDGDLPDPSAPATGPPPAKSWPERDATAAARLAAARTAVAEIGEQLGIPAEALLTPDTLRRVCWQPPTPIVIDTVSLAMDQLDARPWQIELCAEAITAALAIDPDAGTVLEER